MPNVYEGYLNISFINDRYEDVSDYPKSRILPFADSPLYYATISSARRLTHGDDVKTVYDVAITFKEGLIHKFEPGDVIGILPSNKKSEVVELLKRLGIIENVYKTYKLGTLKAASKIPTHLPVCGNLYELFLKHIDIRSALKKIFIKSLAKFAADEGERQQLEHLTSPKGSSDYMNMLSQRTTLLDLLNKFPSCHPPLPLLLENLPPLQPRAYSISSSPLLEGELHFTFVVVELEKNMKGVCSGWLESIINKEKLEVMYSEALIPCYFRKSNSFRLPTDTLRPIIMIGAGTGIAPFKGFLQHRFLQKANATFGETWLLYGCRYSNNDFLFKDEIERMLENKLISKLLTCFSREGSQQKYVQDLIESNAKDFIDALILKNAVIYVCGDAKGLVKNVKKAITLCLQIQNHLEPNNAEKFMKDLEKTNKYIQDAWI